MNLMMYITMMMTGLCAFGLAGVALADRKARSNSRRVVLVLNGSHHERVELRKKQQVQRHLFAALHWVRNRVGLTADAKLVERLDGAGLTTASYQDLYLAARLLGPIFAVVAGSFSPWNRTVCIVSLAGISYLAPDFILTRMIKRRREKIRLSIPDSVDLLVICVDAGLGMDQAMLRVAQELGKRHPALQQELLRINREQRAGKQRLEAWQSMADRNQVPELDGFVNMLQQTERFGTPIARALANYGDQIRQKRRQRAEELAAKTTVKIIFPLVLCIFPSLFIVLLGPPGIKVAHGVLSGQ